MIFSILSVSLKVKFSGREVDDSSAVQFIVPLIMILTDSSGCSVEMVSVVSSVVVVASVVAISLANVVGSSVVLVVAISVVF